MCDTYIVVTSDNELVAVVEAKNPLEARRRVARVYRMGMAFLHADRIGDKGLYDLRGKETARG